MKVSITHVYSSKNKGDAAILVCQLDELKRVFPGAQFEIATLARSVGERVFDDVIAERSLMSTVVGGGAPRPLRPLLGVTMMASTTLWAAAKRHLGIELPLPAVWRLPIQRLAGSDAQVCVGGGYLRGVPTAHSTYLMTLLVHQIVLGYLLGKPVYLYAQSFGPFYGDWQERLFRAACACSALIMPRESISDSVARKATTDTRKIVPGIDTAFLVQAAAEPADLGRYFDGAPPPVVVGLTARQWLDAAGQQAYEQGLAEMVGDILDRGWGVLVIPQVTAAEHGDDDREVGKRLAARFRDRRGFACVDEDLSIRGVLALYASLDYLIGTRFHSVIFSLCSGVPCLAIEYEHKTSGILRDLGLDEWCIPIEQVTGTRLRAMFQALVARRDVVAASIPAKIEQARVRARASANAIADHLRARSPRQGAALQPTASSAL